MTPGEVVPPAPAIAAAAEHGHSGLTHATLYHWGGSHELVDTVMHRRRTVPHPGTYRPACSLDIRRWVMPEHDDFMRSVWKRIERRQRRHLEANGAAGNYDVVAKAAWNFVVERIKFLPERHGHDFWQLPSETLALGHGDCEDKSFLAASLMLAAGIPEDRVRVTMGAIYTPTKPREERLTGHAWPMYRDDGGCWAILETSLAHLTVAEHRPDGSRRVRQAGHTVAIDRAVLMEADRLAAAGRRHQYVPLFCLNDRHVFAVEETEPGRLEAAAQLHPDWTTRPTFRELWVWEQHLAHGAPELEAIEYRAEDTAAAC